MKLSLMRTAPIFLGIAAIIACGSDSTPPSVVVGSYTATQFTTTGSSGQTNQILAGSTLNLTLASGGGVTGHLHIAASGADPVFDADMAGTWARTGNTIDFDGNADTFVKDMPFTIEANGDLVGAGTFAGTAIALTLSRV
jgi:hypothetical protein